MNTDFVTKNAWLLSSAHAARKETLTRRNDAYDLYLTCLESYRLVWRFKATHLNYNLAYMSSRIRPPLAS